MAYSDLFSAVLEEIHEAHGQQMAAAGDEPYNELDRALEMLPKDGVVWAVAKPILAVFARSADTLFQIVLNGETKRATVTSRPVDGGELAVGLALGARSEGNGISIQETNWTFRYVRQAEEMQEWQRITGKITYTNHGEYADRCELFARGLAQQAGWEPPVAELSR
jgi:hypothetical protein